MKTENNKTIKNTNLPLNLSFPIFSQSYKYEKFQGNDMHSHEFFEIGITFDGYAEHNLGDTQYQLHRGSIYLIPIGESHEIIARDSYWHVQNIYFLPKLLFEKLNLYGIADDLINQFLLYHTKSYNNKIIHYDLTQNQMVVIEHLICCYQKTNLNNKQLENQFDFHCLINILLVICDSYYAKFPKTNSSYDKRINQIMNIIHQNINMETNCLLAIIAETLSLHPQYINKIVKKATGTSLSKLIIDNKMEYSCNLLLEFGSITEVAQILSFYDHSHYNKYFKRYFGCSPMEYIKKLHPLK